MRKVWLFVVGTAMSGAVFGCGQSAGPPKDLGDTSNPSRGDNAVWYGGDSAGQQQGPCGDGTPSNISAQSMSRSAVANQTELSVAFTSLECISVPTDLEFRVSMTNHSCNIPGYNLDLEQHVGLSTSDGLAFSDGFTYDVLSADDHHPLGLLTVSARRAAVSIIGCATQSISLEISGIDQPADQSVAFIWEGAVLDGVRDCPP